jgi:hypothetical protein
MPQEVEASTKICEVSGNGGVMMREIQGSVNSWFRHQDTSLATLAGILCLMNVEETYENEAERQ